MVFYAHDDINYTTMSYKQRSFFTYFLLKRLPRVANPLEKKLWAFTIRVSLCPVKGIPIGTVAFDGPGQKLSPPSPGGGRFP